MAKQKKRPTVSQSKPYVKRGRQPKNLFPIVRQEIVSKSRANPELVKRTMNSILYRVPSRTECFQVSASRNDGIKIESLPGVVQRLLRKVNKNITISSRPVGVKGNYTAVKIWRIQ